MVHVFKRTLGVSFVLACVFASAGCGGHTPQASKSVMSFETVSPPRVDVNKPVILSHHFGTVRAGQSVEHAFTVSNPSDEDWTVAGIVNSCRCTFAKDLPQVIKAGSSAEVRVVYDAKGDARDDATSVRRAVKSTNYAPGECECPPAVNDSAEFVARVGASRWKSSEQLRGSELQ
ncbi:MAG: DUF1573 domain-containing protein [Planctomycetota bacterium]